MTSNSNSHNFDSRASAARHSDSDARMPDVMQRDRFEMLSAYLDGEVSADERRQVEEWLQTDATVQQLHARLLKLRQAFQAMPVPTSQQSVDQTVNAVLSRVDRRPSRSMIWGGAAIAAVAIGTVASLIFGGERPFAPQMANDSSQENVQTAANSDEEPLMVALDKPLVSLTKAPVENGAYPSPAALDSNDNIR